MGQPDTLLTSFQGNAQAFQAHRRPSPIDPAAIRRGSTRAGSFV